jgi:hypothetical protein
METHELEISGLIQANEWKISGSLPAGNASGPSVADFRQTTGLPCEAFHIRQGAAVFGQV